MPHDSFCAICGGPNILVLISKSPRSKYFKKRLEATLADRKAKSIPDHEHTYLVRLKDHPQHILVDEDGNKEEHTYDCEIITEDDIQWTKAFYGLSLGIPEDEDYVKG